MRGECPRSADVAAALMAGGLSGGCPDDDVRCHLEACQPCADLALVIAALRAERAKDRLQAPVPSAGLVWWRAQLRQRQQAARMATAPVTALHLLTLAFGLALAVALAWWASGSIGAGALVLHARSIPAWLSSPSTVSPALVRYGLGLAASAWLVLAPVAVYLVLRRD
jgi:hypothetical protein